MALTDKTNEELQSLYLNELALRIHNEKNLKDTLNRLGEFFEFLQEFPPSIEKAKSFLTRFLALAPRTQQRYSQMIQAFMTWYGLPLAGIRVRIPKDLPVYIENDDIEKLLTSLDKKRGYSENIKRDRLLILTALKTGMRRSELANLKRGDIHDGFLVVRKGKGNKDRTIPLVQSLQQELNDYIEEFQADDIIFLLSPGSLGNRIRNLANRAGLDHIHTHSLRHKFATDLIERGANIREIQALMGHENLSTTEVYLGYDDNHLVETISLLNYDNNFKLSTSRTIRYDNDRSTLSHDPIATCRQQTNIHSQKVFSSVRLLAKTLLIPSFMDRHLWRELPVQLHQGVYYSSIGVITLDSDNQIEVSSNNLSQGFAEPHIEKSLMMHLATCQLPRYSSLVGESGRLIKFQQLVNEYAYQIITLWFLIASALKDETLSHANEIIPDSITKSFIVTVWVDTIHRTIINHDWIVDSWYQHYPSSSDSPYVTLKCGGSIIGYFSELNSLIAYQDLHINLREKWKQHAESLGINRLSTDITYSLIEIKNRLLEFSDLPRLLGYCELCAPKSFESEK